MNRKGLVRDLLTIDGGLSIDKAVAERIGVSEYARGRSLDRCTSTYDIGSTSESKA